MSFSIYDVNGFVGDFATTTGLSELSRFIEEQEGQSMEDAKGFLQMGGALITNDLIDGFRIAAPRKDTIRETVTNLVELLEKCDTVAIISDGLNDDLQDLEEE